MTRSLTAILLLTALLGGGHTVYSAFQIQVPGRTSLKVTPDAASIWSWHKEIQLPNPPGGGLGTHRERVLVDFDGNGRMDTEDPEVRVTVTDLQVVLLPTNGSLNLPQVIRVWLASDATKRWYLLARQPTVSQNASEHCDYQSYLSTPIVLTPNSDLFVDFEYGPNTGVLCVVSLIGREVVL